jgi:hypothetical protein
MSNDEPDTPFDVRQQQERSGSTVGEHHVGSGS